MSNQNLHKKEYKKPQSSCETCVWYDYDEFYGEYVCRADLDEDEEVDRMFGNTGSCPLYRFGSIINVGVPTDRARKKQKKKSISDKNLIE